MILGGPFGAIVAAVTLAAATALTVANFLWSVPSNEDTGVTTALF